MTDQENNQRHIEEGGNRSGHLGKGAHSTVAPTPNFASARPVSGSPPPDAAPAPAPAQSSGSAEGD